MLKPEFIFFNYSYQRPDNNISIANFTDLPLDFNLVKDQRLVNFPAGTIGGNHFHSRTEWFLPLGDLTIYWQDSDQSLHHQFISHRDSDQLCLIKIPSLLPHALKNHSSEPLFMLEFADETGSSDSQPALLL